MSAFPPFNRLKPSRLEQANVGALPITVTVNDAHSSAEQSFVWNVSLPELWLASIPSQNNLAGDAVTLALQAWDRSGGSLSYSSSGLPGGLTLNSSTGLLTGTLSAADAGTSYNPVITAGDGSSSVSRTFGWSVSPATLWLENVPDQNNSVGDNVTLKVYASSTGELGLSYSASGLPGGLTLNSSTGLITGTPSLADQDNSYTPTLTVVAAGTTGSVAFSWYVGSANATSLVVGNTINTQDNVVGDAILLQVYSNDPDDLPLTYTASNLPGGLSINSSTGLISGTLPVGDGGNTYAVSVVISDSQSSGSLNFLWLVAANSSPGLQLEPIADQTNLNGDVAKLQVYAENASTSPTYSSSNLPSSASINPSTGLISGTLSTGVCTPTVTVTAGCSSFSETFDWTVNTRPTGTLVLEALPDQANVAGDAVLLQSYGSEPGGPALTYTASSLPGDLSINSSTGLITGTLAMVADGDTSYQASVSVSDGSSSVVQSFFWEVMAPPALVLEGMPNQENEAGFAVRLQVEAGSQDNLALSYMVSDLPPGLSLNPSSGLISGTLNPADSLVGSYGPTLTVSNGYTSAAVSFSWIVDPSVLSLAPITGQTTSEGQSVSLALSAWDSNSSAALYFNASGLPAGLSINASTGLISGTVALGDGNNGGTYSPVVTVFDGISSVSENIGWSIPSAISITQPANQSSTEGTSVSLAIAASDATSGATLSYSVSGLPLGLTINPSTGVIGGTVALGAANGGPYVPVVNVSDGLSDQSIAFRWSVYSAVSLGTVANVSDSEGSVVSVSIHAVDGTPSMTLTYSLAGQPNGLQINPSTGLISGTIAWGAANAGSSFTPEVTVTDGKSTEQESINWTVASAISIGSLADQVNTAGDTISLSVSASDGHSGQTLSYSGSDLPTGLSVNPTSGLISGTIASTISYGTSYQPTIAVSDGTSTNEVSLTWTIGALVPAGTFYTQEGTALTVAASVGILDGAVAPDSLSLTVSQVSGTSDGSITVNSDGSFTYTPNSGWSGTDTFVVTVSDGSITSAPITEIIEVSESLGGDYKAVATGDFNGDGNADFVAADYNNNVVAVFLGNGDGTFQTPAPTFSVGTGPIALAVGDFGNGADDIAVANSGSNTVTILMNDGTGSFTTSQTLTVGTDPVALALGDFEGNGSLDLAVANKGSNTVSVFLNNGSGTFTLDTTITVGTSPDGVAAGDLNNDGFDDLVVANSGSNNVSVLLSNGDGTFASAVTYAVGTGPTAVVMADFNGDGNLDVAVANGGSNNVSVLLGNGDGTLQSATTYAVGTDPVALAVGNLGGDGFLDLAVMNHGSNSETVLSNTGDGTFSMTQTMTLGESPDSITVADFANNGQVGQVIDAPILYNYTDQDPLGLKPPVPEGQEGWSVNGVVALLKGTDVGDAALISLRRVKVYNCTQLHIEFRDRVRGGQFGPWQKWGGESKDGGLNGFTPVTGGKVIWISGWLSDAQAAVTLVHELVHTGQEPEPPFATAAQQRANLIKDETEAVRREALFAIQYATKVGPKGMIPPAIQKVLDDVTTNKRADSTINQVKLNKFVKDNWGQFLPNPNRQFKKEGEGAGGYDKRNNTIQVFTENPRLVKWP